MASNKLKFDFDDEFQLSVVSLLLRDYRFARRALSVLDPDYFTDDDLSAISGAAIGYVRKYGVCPSSPSDFLLYMASLGDMDGRMPEFEDSIPLLYEGRMPSGIVVDTVVEWCRRVRVESALSSAMLEMSANSGDVDYSSIRGGIIDAIDSGGILDPGVDLFKDAEDILNRPRKPGACRTGINSLDKVLGGGLGAGEMGLISAPSGRGKSTLAINFACGSLYMGNDIYYYTLEMPKHQASMYFIQCLTGMTKEGIYKAENGKNRALKKLLRIANTYKSNAYIKEFQERKTTYDDIRTDILRRMDETGRAPALIVVDSPYLLKPVRHRARGDEEIEDNVLGVRAIAKELGIAVWGMGQGNRSSEDPDTETMTNYHLAMAYSQAFGLDVSLTINRTSGEIDRGEARIYIAKNREDMSAMSVRTKCDLAKRRFTDMDEGGSD